MMYAPIVLFVHLRPYHLTQTVEALLKNPESAKSDLIIFSDAAKNQGQEEAVQNVRKYIKNIKGFRSITVHHRSYNFGLAKSIIDGVTHVLKSYETVIVLEDDIVTSPFFLNFMNQGLDRFKSDDNVISIHGYLYPVRDNMPEAFFLKGADCWGWATWRRGWNLFQPDGQILVEELKRKGSIKDFNYNNTINYFDMLKGQINGKNDSWAIRWYASAFLANKLTLHPGRSLVQNIGNDSSGIHSNLTNVYNVNLSKSPIDLSNIKIEHSKIAARSIEDYHRRKRSLIKKLILYVFIRNLIPLLRRIAYNWLPPAIMHQIKKLNKKKGIRLEGNYSTWEQAVKHSTGYDSEEIFKKVLSSALKVKNGQAAYERDSVIFDEVQYSWPVTAALMRVAAKNNGCLRVLDFGGSLGSSYFQNRKFLEDLSHCKWSVIDQPRIVEAGQNYFQSDELNFYKDIDECMNIEKPNVIIISAVLQYLEDPWTILENLMSLDIESIILDRTPFLNKPTNDEIKIQITPPSIYSAIYPIRLFNKTNFFETVNLKGYKVEKEFKSTDYLDPSATWSGMILKRN